MGRSEGGLRSRDVQKRMASVVSDSSRSAAITGVSMRIALLSVLLGFALMPDVAVHAEEKFGPAELFEKKSFQKGGLTLPYRLLKPAKVESGKTYPLVLFFHGAGERGTDNDKQLVHGVKTFANPAMLEKYPCFVVAPQAPEETLWVDIPWSSPQPKMPETPNANHVAVVALLDDLVQMLPIDRDRQYVTGLSMGGFGTLEMVIRHPDRFAAAAVVCGGTDLSRLPAASKVPLWFFHGANDMTVRVERSREAVEVLRLGGGMLRYTEYPGVGHDSWNQAYAMPELYEWLFAQKRPATP